MFHDCVHTVAKNEGKSVHRRWDHTAQRDYAPNFARLFNNLGCEVKEELTAVIIVGRGTLATARWSPHPYHGRGQSLALARIHSVGHAHHTE